MTDSRQVFHDLQALEGNGFDATALARDGERVERRIARARGLRSAMGSVATVAIAAGLFGAWAWLGGSGAVPGPAASPTGTEPSPAPPSESTDTDAGIEPEESPEWCSSAAVVPGLAVGDFGGLEGWFNATSSAPCDEWDPRIAEHPDTVLIYTGDSTMVEAYYRTGIDALVAFTDLGPDFVVPEPDAGWPDSELVLIDAATSEVLETSEIPEWAR